MDAVIFDMDGVLVDSELHWKAVERELLHTHVSPLSEADVQSFLGMSVDDLHARLHAEHALYLSLDQFRELYRKMAQRIYDEQVALMPGFETLADELRARKVKLGLASSSPSEWVKRVIDRFSLADRFLAVVSADDVGGRGKPAPDIYLAAAKKLEALPRRCVAIEDSRNGLVAARRAQMACVGLRNGVNDGQDLARASLEVRSFSELNYDVLYGLLPKEKI